MKRQSIKYRGEHEFQVLRPKQGSSLSLVIAGAGYHTDLPLLYFISQLLVTTGDVLQAKYSSIPTEVIEEAWFEISSNRKYESLFVVGKSAGASKASRLIENNKEFENAKVIWLTPLIKNEKLFERLMTFKNPSLLIIGNKDRHYDAERLAQLRERANFQIKIIPNATHSLEYVDKGNVEASLEILKEIIEEVASFIGEKGV